MLLGTLSLIAGLAAVTASAWLVAATLRLRYVVDFLLAVYVLATAGVIVVSLVLSPGDMLTRGWLLATSGIVLVAAAGLWWARGRPPAPSFRAASRLLLDTLRDPVLAVPAAAFSAAFAYLGVLALATPPNDFDTLWYHLPRAALWRQEHGIEYIARANDLRLNVFAAGSEIVTSWTMTLAGHERFSSLLQFVALPATMLAVAGIARKIGLERRAALLGALLFASLPVVLLQSAMPLNDLVTASFLVVAVHFLLSGARWSLALGALALALAVATKATALLALPMLLLVALVLTPRRRWIGAVAAGVLGIVAGGFWYVFNHSETGSFFPRFAPSSDAAEQSEELLRYPALLVRMAVDAVDPAGAVGRDRWLYGVAAAVVVVAFLLARRRGRRAQAIAAITAGLVLVPLAFPTLHDEFLRGYQRTLLELDRSGLAFVAFDRDSRTPSPFVSWYGPLATLVFLATVVIAIREALAGRVRRGAVFLAALPLLYAAIVVVGIGYSEYHGRYLMPAVAFAATTWGLLLRVRPLAWAASTIAVTTIVLSVVHFDEKPAGFSVLGGDSEPSVWRLSRVGALERSHWNGGGGPVEVLEEEARAGSTIALRIRQDDVSYPFFGAALDRRIVFLGEGGEGLEPGADWLVVAPGLDSPACARGWTEVATAEPEWRLYRRTGLCPGESASS